MYDYMNEHLVPTLEKLKRQVHRLETRYDQQPVLEIEIEAGNIDVLIAQLLKLYDNFAVKTNLQMRVKLKGA